MGHDSPATDDLRLFQTGGHACGYWPERSARDLVLDPRDPRLAQVYPQALDWGFRRSGDLVYRPHCAHCRACVAVRIPVADFVPDRSQRRAAKRHADLRTLVARLGFAPEHYALYLRYQSTRHAGGGMDHDSREQYAQFLLQSKVNTRLVEFRDAEGTLRMVSIIDLLDDGLSSVYTFFDPDEPNASYGTYNVLWQIEQCRHLGLQYLYLGYWIAQSPKMAYKARFRPIEQLVGGQWQALAAD